MARRLDRIVVVDLEATCWEGAPPEGEESEILEIGICLLDPDTGERSAANGILVRPEVSRVSEFCTRLTTLTPAMVAEGLGFAEAIAQVKRDYAPKDRILASYGDYDRKMLEKQCAARGVTYPFSSTHWNVKSLAAMALGLDREVGLDRCLEHFGFPLEGTHHRGKDDAWNIARILGVLLERMRTSPGKAGSLGRTPAGRPEGTT